jgi:predicted DNA-binding WGR domain protein
MESRQHMIRVYADFNEGTPEDQFWILHYDGEILEKQLGKLGLRAGDQVILYQDENDFEVSATLKFGFIQPVGREVLYAIPDWKTIVRKT